MHRPLLIVLILIFITSCQETTSRSIASNQMDEVGQTMAYISNFSQYELNFGLKICSALRSKKYRFHEWEMNSKSSLFHFLISEKTCSGDVTKKNIKPKLLLKSSHDNSFIFSLENDDYSGRFYDEVQTDIHGYLRTICSVLLEGENIMNTIKSGHGTDLQIKFGKKSPKSSQFVINEIVNLNGEKLIQKSLSFEVLTENKRRGVIKLIEEYSLCPNNLDVISFKQELITDD